MLRIQISIFKMGGSHDIARYRRSIYSKSKGRGGAYNATVSKASLCSTSGVELPN